MLDRHRSSARWPATTAARIDTVDLPRDRADDGRSRRSLFIIALQPRRSGPRLNHITFGGLFAQGWSRSCSIFSAPRLVLSRRGSCARRVLSLREKEFVEAARMIGASDCPDHALASLMPHLVAPIDRLLRPCRWRRSSILGKRASPSSAWGSTRAFASWGNLLSTGPDYYLTQPWLMVWPGLAILFTTLAFQPPWRRAPRRVRPTLSSLRDAVVVEPGTEVKAAAAGKAPHGLETAPPSRHLRTRAQLAEKRSRRAEPGSRRRPHGQSPHGLETAPPSRRLRTRAPRAETRSTSGSGMTRPPGRSPRPQAAPPSRRLRIRAQGAENLSAR